MGKKLKTLENNLDGAFNTYGRNSEEYREAYKEYVNYTSGGRFSKYVAIFSIIALIGIGSVIYYVKNANNKKNLNNPNTLEQKVEQKDTVEIK